VSAKKAIATTKAPGAVGPYSQAILSGDLLFLSGQLPINPQTGTMPEGDIRDRVHQIFANIKAVAESAGASLDDVVKVTVFLADISDFAAVNEVYAQYFSTPYPARSAVQVAALPLKADVEIEAIIRIAE
jgi:2-iminobutanoate/2-iminopropanoate deaminase